MKLSKLDFNSLLATLANSMSMVTTKEAKRKLIAHDRAQRSEIAAVSNELADVLCGSLSDEDYVDGTDALGCETEHYTEVDPDVS